MVATTVSAASVEDIWGRVTERDLSVNLAVIYFLGIDYLYSIIYLKSVLLCCPGF